MVDAVDLKSFDRKVVRVRVPPCLLLFITMKLKVLSDLHLEHFTACQIFDVGEGSGCEFCLVRQKETFDFAISSWPVYAGHIVLDA